MMSGKDSNVRSLQGHFLVASPRLPDPNFSQAVVLVIEHNEQGAFGLVLNRPSNITIGKFFEEFEELHVDNGQLVRIGGPLLGPVMSLHQVESLSGEVVLPGVYLTSDKSGLQSLVKSDEPSYLFFNGYTGWGNGQLEGELKLGGWLISKATSKHVFRSDFEKLWKILIESHGREILRDALGMHKFPENPTLN